MESRWVDVASARAVRRSNRARAVKAGRCRLLLCNVDGALYAIADTCTHDGGQLFGRILGRRRLHGPAVQCPRHGARFDVRDGSVLAPPAVRPIETYPARITGTRVEVQVPAACLDERPGTASPSATW